MASESDGKHTRRGRRAAGSARDELFHGPKMDGHPASTDRVRGTAQRPSEGGPGVRDRGLDPGKQQKERCYLAMRSLGPPASTSVRDPLAPTIRQDTLPFSTGS